MIPKSALSALTGLVELAEKATPGEWRSEKEDTDSGLHADWLVQAICGHSWDNIAACGGSSYEDDWVYTEELRQANARFIAATRNAIPALKAILQSLEPTEARAVGELVKRDGMLSFHSLIPLEQIEPGLLFASPLPKAETQPVEEYRGMEYPLEELPAIWLALAEELRGNAKEVEQDEPEQATRFRHRAISIIACAEQLKWSLAHPSPQPEAATIDAEAAAKEIIASLRFWKRRLGVEMDVQLIGPKRMILESDIANIIRKHASEHAGEQGWVRVPREPTEAMMKAAYAAQGGVNNQIRAAIAAAPDSAGKK